MNDLRALIATALFCISLYLVVDLIAHGFSWAVLCAALAGFVLAHYVWPPKRDDEAAWFDWLELVVDLPFRSIALLVRGIGKMIRNSDGDIGIDL